MPHLARQAISNNTQKLQVLPINFVMIHKKYCWPWLVQKHGCSWHTEWFATLKSAHIYQRLPTPFLRRTRGQAIYCTRQFCTSVEHIPSLGNPNMSKQTVKTSIGRSLQEAWMESLGMTEWKQWESVERHFETNHDGIAKLGETERSYFLKEN